MPTPFDQYGLTPDQVQQALAASGSGYQLAEPTFGLQAMADANPQLLPPGAQPPRQAPADPSMQPAPTFGLQAMADANRAPPQALTSVGGQPFMAPLLTPQTQLRPPSVNPYAQTQRTPSLNAGSAGLRNPLPGIERDARARAADAERGFADATTDFVAGNEQQRQAALDAGEAQAATARRLANLDREAAFDMAGREELHKARVKAFEDSTAKTHDEIKSLEDDVANGEPKDRRSPGQKALSVIAIMLGGIGQGFSRAGGVDTPNAGLEMVNLQIQRDLDRQRELLANKRTALAAKQSDLGIAREKFGATQQADQAAYLMSLKRFETEAQAAKNEGLSKEASAAADQLIGQLQQRQGEVLMNLHGSLLDKNRAQADALAVTQWREQQAARARAQQMQDPRLPGGVVVADPVIYGRLTEKQRGEVPAAIEAREKAAQALEEIRRLRAEHPVARGFDGSILTGGVQSEVSKRIASAHTRYTTALKGLEELGALDKGTVELAGQMTGDPSTWSDDADAVLADVEASLHRDTGRYLKNRGVAIGADSANTASAAGQAAPLVRPGAAR